MRRTFVALSLPEAAHAELEEARLALRRRAAERRWPLRLIDPVDLHLTLKFLGPTPAEELARVHAAIASALTGAAPIRTSVSAWLAFPSEARARVIALGFHDTDGVMTTLAERLDAALGALGFPREQRRFVPHVTLARLRNPRDVRQALPAAPALELELRRVTWFETTPTAPGTATPGTATPGTATPGTATPGTATPGTAAPAHGRYRGLAHWLG